MITFDKQTEAIRKIAEIALEAKLDLGFEMLWQEQDMYCVVEDSYEEGDVELSHMDRIIITRTIEDPLDE